MDSFLSKYSSIKLLKRLCNFEFVITVVACGFCMAFYLGQYLYEYIH